MISRWRDGFVVTMVGGINDGGWRLVSGMVADLVSEGAADGGLGVGMFGYEDLICLFVCLVFFFPR